MPAVPMPIVKLKTRIPPSLPSRGLLRYVLKMNIHDALATFRRHESALRAPGVAHTPPCSARLRVATTSQTVISTYWQSLSRMPTWTIYDYVRFKEYVASLFQGPVDVIDRAALKPHLRAPSVRDAVYAF